jgi:hypothetical protein
LRCAKAKAISRVLVGVWLSPVEHCVRDAGVAGSNPATPTILSRFSGVFLDFVIVVSFKNDLGIRCFERDLNVTTFASPQNTNNPLGRTGAANRSVRAHSPQGRTIPYIVLDEGHQRFAFQPGFMANGLSRSHLRLCSLISWTKRSIAAVASRR